MARNSARPGRTVVVFFAVLAAAFGLVAVIGTWKPALGLDLQGGTQIILTAKDSNVTSDQLKEAANIIDARVNGSGVSEATVNTQGSSEVVVQVPGPTNNSLVQTVVRHAQLYFRLVAQVPQTTSPSAPSPSASTSPGSGVLAPSPSAKATGKPSSKSRSAEVSAPATTARRRSTASRHPQAKATQSPSASPSTSPSSSPSSGADDRRGWRADLDVGGHLHRGQPEGVPTR